MTMPKKIREVYAKSTCLYSKQQVEAAIDKMAVDIHERLEDANPVLLVVMIGGCVIAGQLLTRLDFPLELDYIHATRYKSGLSGGEIDWCAKPRVDLKDRTVLVIDDILDGGITLSTIIDYCREQGAKEVLTAVLADKEEKRVPGGLQKADFVGLVLEDRYVFGYGLDYKEYLRNAPGIYAVAPEHG